MFIEFQIDIKKMFPNIPITHGIYLVFFMYLNKFIVKVKRDILTFFVQPCLSPFQLDRGLMTHIKLKSFKHEWIYLKLNLIFDCTCSKPISYSYNSNLFISMMHIFLIWFVFSCFRLIAFEKKNCSSMLIMIL